MYATLAIPRAVLLFSVVMATVPEVHDFHRRGVDRVRRYEAREKLRGSA